MTRANEALSRFGAILRTARRKPSRRLILAAAGAFIFVSAFLHLYVISRTQGALYDVESFSIQAATVFEHSNVYTTTNRYPYPPVWIWIVAAMQWVSWQTHLPFSQVVKLPAMLGDLAIVGLLAQYAIQRLGYVWSALIPAALYALNPIVLLISAGHGQFDSLVLCFVLLAITVRGVKQDEHVGWAAAALGVAIALKGYPILVLPYFVLTAPTSKRILTIGMAFVPLALGLLLYSALFGYSSIMVANILAYRSPPDYGWGYVLAATPSLAPALQYGAGVFLPVLLIFAAFVPCVFSRGCPAAAIALLFALFYALTYSMGSQYLIWILPFLCLALPGWVPMYTIAALLGGIGYYAQYSPSAVPSGRIGAVLFAVFAAHRLRGVIAIICVSGLMAVTLVLTSPRVQQTVNIVRQSLSRASKTAALRWLYWSVEL